MALSTSFPSGPKLFTAQAMPETLRLLLIWFQQIEQWNLENIGGGGAALSAVSAGALAQMSFATVISETRDLPKSRILTAGAGVSLTDAGAGNTLTISASATTGTLFGTPLIKTIADSPFTIPTGNVFLDASSSASADFIANLPAATGSGFVKVIKKTDANAKVIAVTPNGADTIDAVAAVDNVIVQQSTFWYIDEAAGRWKKL